MRQSWFTFPALLLAFMSLAIISTGCNDDAPKKDDDSHSHDHDHDDHGHADHDHPAHGPNGGHIFDLDTKDYTVEWCKFKDNDVIKMHIIGSNGKNSAIKVDSFKVMPTAGNEDLVFEMEAENAGDDGTASTFMADSADLSTAIPLGVKVEIKSGDNVYKGEIKAHKPLDH